MLEVHGTAERRTSLLDFPWVVVRCHFCTRSKDARLALAWLNSEHATLKWLLAQFRKPYPHPSIANRRSTAENAAPIAWTSAAPRRRT